MKIERPKQKLGGRSENWGGRSENWGGRSENWGGRSENWEAENGISGRPKIVKKSGSKALPENNEAWYSRTVRSLTHVHPHEHY